MTKADLVDAVKNTRGINLTRKETEAVINAVFDVLAVALRRHKKFTFPGFGRFLVRHNKARVGSDPRTGDSIRIRSSKSVAFKAAPKLRNSL
ncbi:MAG: DNA-binding protein HU-beta [Myxococcota bacterium]|jgi:DNA-binding protein HU-beta